MWTRYGPATSAGWPSKIYRTPKKGTISDFSKRYACDKATIAMSQNYRKERLDELLWQELNTIVMYEMDDPVLNEITISRVDVTRDLQVARVYVSPADEEIDQRLVLRHLDRAKGFLRSQIAARVQLRRVPELVFKMDVSLAYVERIDAILDQLSGSEESSTPPGGDAS
ncbi:MAG: 30S ribosome-binding factor RbfA [Caldilineae bacterium]|nr:MAG: 30S ribosome-binding factor RbfA [Caldilineae bacterium]